MTSFKLATFGVALFALASAGCAQAPPAHANMKMSAADKTMMSSCMSKSHEDMMKDAGCNSMMEKMKMSESDMQEMTACRKMPHDEMMKDGRCASMMKMHSGMMKMNMPS
jgi:hypothetical protein